MKATMTMFAGFSPQAVQLFRPLIRDLTGIARTQMFDLLSTETHEQSRAGDPACIVVNGESVSIAVCTYVQELRDRYPFAQILILGRYALTADCLRELEAYRVSVLAGAVSQTEIEDCRTALRANRIYRCQAALETERDMHKKQPHAELSMRERCVLIMLIEGKSIKETAAGMHVAASSVSTYRRRALSKWVLSGRWNPYYISKSCIHEELRRETNPFDESLFDKSTPDME